MLIDRDFGNMVAKLANGIEYNRHEIAPGIELRNLNYFCAHFSSEIRVLSSRERR
jgi:hypothetical protein